MRWLPLHTAPNAHIRDDRFPDHLKKERLETLETIWQCRDENVPLKTELPEVPMEPQGTRYFSPVQPSGSTDSRNALHSILNIYPL